MQNLLRRAVPGFIAGAIAVLAFQQGAWALLHILHRMPPAWPMNRIPPWGVPQVFDLAFWGGLWGIAFALVVRRPGWLPGLVVGVLSVAVYFFVVTPLKGGSAQAGLHPEAWLIPLALNLPWGVGLGLLLAGWSRR
jgi:hypothetical protein